jgi:hypothetical protein
VPISYPVSVFDLGEQPASDKRVGDTFCKFFSYSYAVSPYGIYDRFKIGEQAGSRGSPPQQNDITCCRCRTHFVGSSYQLRFGVPIAEEPEPGLHWG